MDREKSVRLGSPMCNGDCVQLTMVSMISAAVVLRRKRNKKTTQKKENLNLKKENNHNKGNQKSVTG